MTSQRIGFLRIRPSIVTLLIVVLTISSTTIAIATNTQVASAQTFCSSSGCFNVTGPILTEYANEGGPTGVLGYPTSNQFATTCQAGQGAQYNNFQHGAITWTPTIGAHTTYGPIRQEWANMSFECSVLGLRTSDQTATTCDSGQYINFQGGAITWSLSTGARYTYTANAVSNSIRAQWLAEHAECGPHGLPITDPYPCAGSICQTFQYNGVLTSAAELKVDSYLYPPGNVPCTNETNSGNLLEFCRYPNGYFDDVPSDSYQGAGMFNQSLLALQATTYATPGRISGGNNESLVANGVLYEGCVEGSAPPVLCEDTDGASQFVGIYQNGWTYYGAAVLKWEFNQLTLANCLGSLYQEFSSWNFANNCT